jgi:hypothetical protein
MSLARTRGSGLLGSGMGWLDNYWLWACQQSLDRAAEDVKIAPKGASDLVHWDMPQHRLQLCGGHGLLILASLPVPALIVVGRGKT